MVSAKEVGIPREGASEGEDAGSLLVGILQVLHLHGDVHLYGVNDIHDLLRGRVHRVGEGENHFLHGQGIDHHERAVRFILHQ